MLGKKMLQELTNRSNTATPDFAQLKSLLNLKSSAHVSMILTGKRRIANEQLNVLQKNIKLKPLELAYITAVVTLKSSFRRNQIINGLTSLLEQSESLSSERSIPLVDKTHDMYRGGFFTLEQDDYYIFNLRLHVFLSQLTQGYSQGEGDPSYLNVSLVNFAENSVSSKNSSSQDLIYEKRKNEFKKFISSILDDIRNKNRNLSLRSIARKLGVSSAMLSLIVHGKRSMSDDLAIRFSEVTSLDDYAKEKLRLLAAYCRSASREEVIEHKSRLGMFPYSQENDETEELRKSFWNNTSHPVLAALENLDGFEENMEWIKNTSKFPMGEEQVKESKNLLKSSKLVGGSQETSQNRLSLIYKMDQTKITSDQWNHLLSSLGTDADGNIIYRIPVYASGEKYLEMKKMIQQFLRGVESSFATNVGQKCFHLNFCVS